MEITLDGEVIPSMQTTMTRIFNNGSFEEGGRFYCQLQNLKKTQRTNLRFNGEPTIEIDYSGMHPHLLYHLQGMDFEGDPYEIEGFDRSIVKVAFNTLINRDSKKHRGSPAQSLASNLELTMSEAMSLESAIYRLHKRISGYFNSGYGLKLQKIDSQMAYEVMKLFILNRNRPVLMIHDSAIVSVRDVEDLKLSMADVYPLVLEQESNILRSNKDFYPMPKGLKVTAANFNEELNNTISKALEGIDVTNEEWTSSIDSYLYPSQPLL